MPVASCTESPLRVTFNTSPEGTPTPGCGVPLKGSAVVYHTSIVLELLLVRATVQSRPRSFSWRCTVNPLSGEKVRTDDISLPPGSVATLYH